MTRAVIFDMDGILLDTESVCRKCWERAAEEFNIERISEAFSRCVGQNTNDTLKILEKFCKGKCSPAEFHDRTSELFYVVEREEGLSKMPFVDECLTELKRRGLRLAVASSTRMENVGRQLRNAGIWGFFETVTTGDTVEHSKPAPDIYLNALESLSLSPGECVAVEDSPNGVISAAKAKIRCVMVPDQIPPDELMKKTAWKIVKSLKFLPDLVE